MANELRSVDISDVPDVLRLAEEVARSGAPLLLTSNDTEVAVLSPTTSSVEGERGRPTSEGDPLWRIVGMADSDAPADLPADISSHVDEYLADAHDPPIT